jgi:hypothetical protein
MVDHFIVANPVKPVKPHDDVSAPTSARDSGVRDRETTPAPAGAIDSMVASSRPTRIPDFDFTALASHASLRHRTLRNLSMERMIPTVTSKAAPADLELRLAFLLLHADGATTVGEIAAQVQRPAHDVLASFVELSGLGLVKLRAPG